jgi:hypothetical protein
MMVHHDKFPLRIPPSLRIIQRNSPTASPSSYSMKKRQPDALAFMSPAPQVWFLGCPNSWTFSLTFASCHRATYHRTNANNSINLQENRPEKNKSQNPKPFEGKGLCQEVLFYMEELICSWCLTWLETSRIQ